MFELIESSPDNRPDFGWSGKLISVAIHGFVVSAALSAGREAVKHDYFEPTVLDSQIVWENHIAPPAPAGSPDPGQAPIFFEPPGPIPSAPVDIPTDIPPPQHGTFTEPGPGPSTPGTTLPGSEIGSLPRWAIEVRDARLVDELPELMSHPDIRYPEMARQAGLEGRVMVETVLDTLGRADRARTRVTSSPHALFEAEALRVVIGSRYKAGRVGGRAVPVRVQVPVSFTIRQ